MKTFKLSDVAKAIRDDGLPQSSGWFFHNLEGRPINRPPIESNYEPIASACALGMAAINLNVAPIPLHIALNDVDDSYIGAYIARLNDHKGWSFDEIADWLDEWVKKNADVEMTLEEFEYSAKTLENYQKNKSITT